MFRPLCPNHGCSLSPTDDPGMGRCEISGVLFECEEDISEEEEQIDKYGNPTKTFTVRQVDGGTDG